jgi:predicted Zn-dependent protease
VSGDRILSRGECERIAQRAFGLARGGGETKVDIVSWWNGELRWARNRVALASDRRDIRVGVWRTVGGSDGFVSTNQVDDASLEAAVRAAERMADYDLLDGHRPIMLPPLPSFERLETTVWSDATYGLTAEARGDVARAFVAEAETKGVQSTGYLEARAGARLFLGSERVGPLPPWDIPYVTWTQAQCSLTVRNPEGTGSGWAGVSGYDWARIDTSALSHRAIEKCVASQHPVSLEPGRYTVILEAQAVADLWELVARSIDRRGAEKGEGPWALAPDEALNLWRTKLGLKVLDERITVSHDPADPELGILPEPWMEPMRWIDRGVLSSLAYDREYALTTLNKNAPHRPMTGYRMSGGDTSIDEMIRTTTRGLLVTRLSNVRVLDPVSLLATGVTRDGLWLIEHGQISKAVKNFRFTESPLFVFDSIEQLGVPVPVFRPVQDPYDTDAPLTPAIVPPLKVRDFTFSSMIDAI